MSDLVRGKYPVGYNFVKLLGGAANVVQGNIAPRSNLEWLGVHGLTDAAGITLTQVATAVAVPVQHGDVISAVTVLTGGTAAATPTNGFAALYSGIAVPALLGQSADILTGAIAASAAFTYNLATPVVVTPTNAPNGFLYVSLMSKASTLPTQASATVAAAVGYKWLPGGPLFLAATHGSGLTGTAPATIASPTTVATIPVVILT